MMVSLAEAEWKNSPATEETNAGWMSPRPLPRVSPEVLKCGYLEGMLFEMQVYFTGDRECIRRVPIGPLVVSL